MVRVPAFERPFKEPVTVAVDFDVTLEVFTGKVAEVFPARMMTEVGTVAELELLARVTVRPPSGAAPLILTVPMALAPPFTEVGLMVTAVRTGALTFRVPVTLDVP